MQPRGLRVRRTYHPAARRPCMRRRMQLPLRVQTPASLRLVRCTIPRLDLPLSVR